MSERKQQHIGGPMHIQVVEYRDDPADLSMNPAINPAQEVNPVGGRPTMIGFREGLAVMRLKCAEDIAFPAPPVVGFLGDARSLLRLGWWACDVRPFEGLGTLRT